jgi:hypothetical protein
VEGGFDRLGYTPVKEALQRCEGKARYRVMGELNRCVLSFYQTYFIFRKNSVPMKYSPW